MPQALPGGFVDTGITKSFTHQVTLQFLALEAVGEGGGGHFISVQIPNRTSNDSFIISKINSTGSPCLLEDETMGHSVTWNVQLQAPGFDDPEIVETYPGGCESMSNIHNSGSYALSYTAGPFRLGVKYELIDPLTTHYPTFASHYQLRYAWFSDENTTIQATFGPLTCPTRYWVNGGTSAPSPGAYEQGSTIGYMEIFVQIGPASLGRSKYALLTGITMDGNVLDTTGLDDGLLYGTGGGNIEARAADDSSSIAMIIPYSLAYDLDVTRNQTVPPGNSTGAKLNTIGMGDVNAPYSTTRRWWDLQWAPDPFSGYEEVTVDSVWAAAQLVPWRTDDLRVPLFGVPARSSPGPALAAYDPISYSHPSYAPVGLTFAAEVNVHRPDGNRPSDWVSSDTGKLTVSEGPAVTTFTLSQVGATVRREFGAPGTDKPIWRRWCGVGVSGKSDALFHPDRTEVTHHAALGATNQDVFDWGSYGYLRVGMTAPGAVTLTLQVEGVHVSASDPHTTGSDRTDNFSLSETPFTLTYDVPVVAGSNQVDVDLLFPKTGGTPPYYPGRVDALKLSGFGLTTYTLDTLKLVAKGGTYLKLDWGPPVQRGDYSALGWSNGGSHGAGGLPDQANKPDETGISPLGGGNLRYVYILTGAETGVIQDTQLSLDGFLGKLGAIEGWSYTYSYSTFDAANKDSQGNSLSPENAQNARPVVPFALLTPGQSYSPPCNWVCRRLVPTNAQPYMVYTRWPLGFGAFDGVAQDELGRRLPPGVGVALVFPSTGKPLVVGQTGANGYVVLSPVPANASLTYRVQHD